MIREQLNIEGERITLTRLIQTERYVLAVDVEAVIPSDDPSEPCLGPTVIEFLKEAGERAEAGDVEWLKRHGKVYALIDAA